MSPKLAQYMVPVLNAASLFGRTIPGFLSDKIGRFNMMVIMCAFTGKFSALNG
jgi:nitrate/nitrite transporter NarK